MELQSPRAGKSAEAEKVHCGGHHRPTTNREILKANPRAAARLRWHLRFAPWFLSDRRRLAA